MADHPEEFQRLLNILKNNRPHHHIKFGILNLDRKGLTDDDIKDLALALSGNTSIRKLFLSYNHIGSAGTVAIAKALFYNQEIKEIHLSSNHICNDGTLPCDQGIKALAQLLVRNSSLMYLDIANNGINTQSIKPIANALSTNKYLKILGIYANKNIGPVGITIITEALKKNRRDSILETIFISNTCHDHQQQEHKEVLRALAASTYALRCF